MATVTVRSGDSMWAIARRAGIPLDALVRANPQVANPSLIRPGQALNLPGSRDAFEGGSAPTAGGSGGTYRVRPGDSMSVIAQRHGVSLSALMGANPQVRNASLIYAGQTLNLPGGSSARAISTPAPSTRGGLTAAFQRAAQKAGVPTSWATNGSLLQLVKNESGFRVDAKNPRSTAFGLFQFLRSTWQNYLPEVPYGTRDAYWQGVGGFRYIKQRYGTPERALAFWRATVNKNVSIAPPDLRNVARLWINKNYAGY